MNRYLPVALSLLVAGSAFGADKAFDKTFSVSAGGSLVVDADSASVQVSSSDTNQVTVHMTAHGSSEEIADVQLDAVQKGDEVTVTMRRQQKKSWFQWNSWNGDSRIEVKVPRNFGVRVQTGGGNVELTNTVGTATLKTSGGDIIARNVNGNIEARTSGGGIRMDTIRGDVDADTSGGDVRLMNVDGKIRGNTSGGNVECSLVGSNRGITATTSGGSIQVTVPRNTTANIDATTSGGEISTELPVTSTNWKEGRVKGTLNGGGQPIDAHTSGGDVSLRAAN
jgi:DUF4097 and DUF4098 domain-containing protein YvlB